MTYTLTPKQGDKVRVRHPKYGACDAFYYEPRRNGKTHFVEMNGELCVASGCMPAFNEFTCDRVRFIYPLSLMPKPEVRE